MGFRFPVPRYSVDLGLWWASEGACHARARLQQLPRRPWRISLAALHAGDDHGDCGDLGLWITPISLAAPCARIRRRRSACSCTAPASCSASEQEQQRRDRCQREDDPAQRQQEPPVRPGERLAAALQARETYGERRRTALGELAAIATRRPPTSGTRPGGDRSAVRTARTRRIAGRRQRGHVHDVRTPATSTLVAAATCLRTRKRTRQHAPGYEAAIGTPANRLSQYLPTPRRSAHRR
jgi:hypothetical protein